MKKLLSFVCNNFKILLTIIYIISLFLIIINLPVGESPGAFSGFININNFYRVTYMLYVNGPILYSEIAIASLIYFVLTNLLNKK